MGRSLLSFRPAQLLTMAGLALGYLGLAKISLVYATNLDTITLVWLPSGLALAGLLLCGIRCWPGVALGAFLADLVAGKTLLIAGLITVGNTLEAVVGAWLLLQLGFDTTLQRFRDFFRLLMLGGVVSTCVAAVGGVTTLYTAGLIGAAMVPGSLATWWMGDMLGIILLTPALLLWRQGPAHPLKATHLIELAALFTLSALSGLVIFFDWIKPVSNVHVEEFLMFVWVVWAAIRFSPQVTALLIMVNLAQALAGTYLGLGYFSDDLVASGMANFWLYFVVLATTGMALALTIHEVKGNDRALSEEKRRLGGLVERLPGYIYRVANDPDHTPEYISPYVEQVTGYSQDEYLVARTVSCGWEIHEEDKTRVWNEVQAALKAHRPYICSYRIVTKQGDIRWVWEHGRGIHDEDGRLSHLEGFVMDISEQTRAAEALRISEERLALATKAGGVGIWDWDLESGTLLWDDSMFELYGVRATDFAGAYEAWRSCVHPEDLACAEAAVARSIAEKKPIVSEFRIKRPDGVVRHIKALGEVICDARGQPRRMIGTNWDITERRIAESRQADLARILDDSLNEVYVFDQSSLRFIEVNRAARKNLGYTMRELENLTPVDLKPEFTSDRFQDLIEPLRSGRKDRLVFETVHRRKDGSEYLVEVHLQAGTYAGRPVFNAIILDVTERKKAQESLDMAASIYQSSSEAIMVVDSEFHVVDVNPAFARITGYTLDEVAGRSADLLQSGEQPPEFYEEIKRGLLKDQRWQGEIWNRHKDGEAHATWVNISAISQPDGSVYRYIVQFSDITEKKHKDELIWNQANFDTLTGLPNRRLLNDRLEQEIKKSHRSGLPLAVLFIDLDRFKEINDTLGHAKGDLLLIEAADRIAHCVRETDTLARLGGDEFTAILPEFGHHTDIERIATHIIESLSEPFFFEDDDNGYYISASIGITLYPDDAQDRDGLLKQADQAMYQAKGEGRHRYSFFTESMQQEAQEKLVLTQDLRAALSRQELRVYYQPIIEIASGRIVKGEALLRWRHPKRGFVSPATFIPMAEESGLIHEIGEWVFQQAIEDVSRWRRSTGRIVPVSVNKSPVQFDRSARKIEWTELLADYGLPGNSIIVEITEGLLLKDSPQITERLFEFRNRGVEVSIDDFGTGFSALSYLKRFDIDYLKIDRSFINSLTENESDKALTEAIILMAHKLGIATIAEGVETEEQREYLASFGCDYVQGFLYAPAVPAEDFERMLNDEPTDLRRPRAGPV